MFLGKLFDVINIRKIQKKALFESYDYSIFNLSKPLKMCNSNLSRFSLHGNHKDIGVVLKNTYRLNKDSNGALFYKKKALAQDLDNKLILNLVQDKEYSFTAWIKNLEPYILSLRAHSVIIPIDRDVKLDSISSCSLVIQELNPILMQITPISKVVIYQGNNQLSQLSYVVHHLDFPKEVSICLNVDMMISDIYSIFDIKEDIIKYNIENKISMIHTDIYSVKDKDFKELLSVLNSEVIVYGEQI